MVPKRLTVSRRAEMKALMAAIKQFVPTAVVAVLMDVAETTVNNWADGKSMGTLTQRSDLGFLLEGSSLRRAMQEKMERLDEEFHELIRVRTKERLESPDDPYAQHRFMQAYNRNCAKAKILLEAQNSELLNWKWHPAIKQF